MTESEQIELSSGRWQVALDPANGGRIASLLLDGASLLVERPENGEDTDTEGAADPLAWGCYPMVPFAGRVRHGVVRFGDQVVQLPITLGPHAIHGYGFVSPWKVASAETSRAVLSLELGAPWPWAATITQEFELSERALELTMTLLAHERQPVSMGWHPWFARDIGVGSDLSLTFDPEAMYEIDDEAIPTGRLIDVPTEPWDNCFVGVSDPQLTWGSMSLELQSAVPCWVVYNEPSHAACVEPQTGPPNGINDCPDIVESGETRTVSMRWTWMTPQSDTKL